MLDFNRYKRYGCCHLNTALGQYHIGYLPKAQGKPYQCPLHAGGHENVRGANISQVGRLTVHKADALNNCVARQTKLFQREFVCVKGHKLCLLSKNEM